MAGHDKFTVHEQAEPMTWSGRSGLATLRVATWNLLHNHTATLELRAAEAAAHLHDCDVVLLQETVAGGGHDTAQTVADTLGMRVVATATLGSKSAGIEGTPTEYRFGTAVLTALPVHATNAIDFTDGVSGQFASAVVEAGERRYLFIATHFGWGGAREHIRLQQAVELNAHAGTVIAADSRIETAFIGGDLNTDPDSATSRFLTGKHVVGSHESFWVDAWAAAGEGLGITQSPKNVWAKWVAGIVGISDPMQLPDRRIDYLYSRGWAFGRPGSPVRAEVRGRLPKTGIHASDHLGVIADFETPESIRQSRTP